jgi:hypothetical protein
MIDDAYYLYFYTAICVFILIMELSTSYTVRLFVPLFNFYLNKSSTRVFVDMQL